MPETTAQTRKILLDLADIKPYWRNPRNNRLAVEKVKKSITDYGYNQLIAVDKDHVIVVGHTRYLALKALGYKEIEVIELDIPKKKANAYRIVDNKTSEFAEWTDDLLPELREIGALEEGLQEYFKDDLAKILGDSLGTTHEEITAEELAEKNAELRARFGSPEMYNEQTRKITCPHCGEDFSFIP